jgi:hypothetical protein
VLAVVVAALAFALAHVPDRLVAMPLLDALVCAWGFFLAASCSAYSST